MSGNIRVGRASALAALSGADARSIPTNAAVLLFARLMMALLFGISAYGKLAGAAGTETYMEQYGVPGVLVWPAALWELTVAVCLVLGVLARPVCLLAACWCLLTAAIFHTAWHDPLQFMHFWKNVTVAGAFLAFGWSGLPGPTVATGRGATHART